MMLKIIASSVFTLCLLTVSASAGLFSGSVNGTSGAGAYNSITNGGVGFEWSVPENNRFTFTGFGFSNVMENAALAIRDLCYLDGSTYNSTGINGVKLAINKMLSDPLIDEAIFGYNFTQSGGIVTAATSASSETSAYPGTNTLLDLLDFSSDGWTTIRTDFSSPESSCHAAQTFASIGTAKPANVPEPGTLSLFLLGLSSIGSWALLHRKK
jgi:hypothetical protein